jgi:hypothetical protein
MININTKANSTKACPRSLEFAAGWIAPQHETRQHFVTGLAGFVIEI